MAYDPKPEPPAPPTIGFLKGQGLTAARIFCADIWCGRMTVVAFNDIGLPEDTPFPSIKSRRRWKYQRCGNREVSVIPDWRDPQKVQAERVKQTGNSQSSYGEPSGRSAHDLLHLVQCSRPQKPGR